MSGIISSLLGAQGSFASVGGAPGVESTPYEVRLNYLHVFQPEMFFAIAGKEAANFFVAERMVLFDGTDWMAPILPRIGPEHERVRERDLRTQYRRLLRKAGLDPLFLAAAANFVDALFLKNHFTELLTLEICYAGNWALFSFWNLGSFLQTPGAYTRKGRLDEQEVARFLFRLRMLAGRMDRKEFRTSIEAFGDPTVTRVYELCETQLDQLVRKMFGDRVFGPWFSTARRNAEDMARGALGATTPAARLPDLQAEAKARAAEKRKLIAAGHVPRFGETEGELPFHFCQHVLYGYLELLKSHWAKVPVLPRTPAGKLDLKSRKTKGSSVQFDPLGGVFAHEAETRRDLFKYRSAVTMSLWDLGLKTKREALGPIISAYRPVQSVSAP